MKSLKARPGRAMICVCGAFAVRTAAARISLSLACAARAHLCTSGGPAPVTFPGMLLLLGWSLYVLVLINRLNPEP